MNTFPIASSRAWRWLPLVALAALLVAALYPATALAQEGDPREPVVLQVASPEDVPLGDPARIIAYLRDKSGKPIAAASIVFTSPASFAGAAAEMDLGSVVTDAQGEAFLDYSPTIQGVNQIIARFYGDDSHRPAQSTTTLVATGQRQLVYRSAGVELPALGPWTLVLVLAGVWTVYFTAMLLVSGIPGEERPQSSSESGGAV